MLKFNRSYQAGFTLIEVLVAALVLAIGLLGLAGLQTRGLRHNHSAYLRTTATAMAYDLSDRMRTNLAAFQQGNYNNPAAADHGCVWNGSSVSTCTPQQKAEHDFKEWTDTLAQNLPAGTGIVCLDSTPADGGDANNDGTVDITDAAEIQCDNAGNLHVIKVWWQDDRENDDFKLFVLTFKP